MSEPGKAKNMHLDEYEISLFREVGVCKSHIRKYQGLLDKMEARYGMTTAVFRAQYDSRPCTANNHDFTVWFAASNAISTWATRQREYENAYRLMKI
jgi:hypothetical protein